MEERAELRRAEASGRFAQVVRDVIHHADEREDHQRQEELHKADRHGKLVVQQALRLGENAQRHQRAVDDALFAENDHPAKGADDRAGEHREDGQRHHHALVPGMFGDVIRRREAEQRAERRAQQAEPQAADKHLLEVHIPKEREIRGERKALARKKRGQAKRKQRNEHEKHDKQHTGQHQRRRNPTIFSIHRRFHPFRRHNVR